MSLIDMEDREFIIEIAGMGGSGVSGRIFSELCGEKKISVVDSYNLPGFVNKDDR